MFSKQRGCLLNIKNTIISTYEALIFEKSELFITPRSILISQEIITTYTRTRVKAMIRRSFADHVLKVKYIETGDSARDVYLHPHHEC